MPTHPAATPPAPASFPAAASPPAATTPGPASQAVPKENEGVTSLVLGGKAVSLVEALAVAEGPLFGSCY